jgi:hypothetical protein
MTSSYLMPAPYQWFSRVAEVQSATDWFPPVPRRPHLNGAGGSQPVASGVPSPRQLVSTTRGLQSASPYLRP